MNRCQVSGDYHSVQGWVPCPVGLRDEDGLDHYTAPRSFGQRHIVVPNLVVALLDQSAFLTA